MLLTILQAITLYVLQNMNITRPRLRSTALVFLLLCPALLYINIHCFPILLTILLPMFLHRRLSIGLHIIPVVIHSHCALLRCHLNKRVPLTYPLLASDVTA